MLFSGRLWWCGKVSGIASDKCLLHSPAAILLAVLARVVLVRELLVRQVAALVGAAPQAGMDAAVLLEVVVGVTIVLQPVLEAVREGRRVAPVRVVMRTLVNPDGRIPMVDQMLVVLRDDGRVGALTVVPRALADRVDLV